MTKFRVTLKDPDGVFESVRDHALQLAAKVKANAAVVELREGDWATSIKEDIDDDISRWVRHGEYVTIEFDTDAGTATVVEVGK